MKTNLDFDKQGGVNENTLSFLPRKRECIKTIDNYIKSGAKVALLNESGNVLGNNLQQFNNLRI